MSKIDFVVTWVDENDPKWRQEKETYEKLYGIDSNLNSEERYRDWGIFMYWFRAVEKYAPWVNRIHFVTEGHVPEWLNTKHDKINIVKHADFIPAEYLPTFNSNVIELNLHRIDQLSNEFVLFNDDMILNDFVSDIDFFVNHLPCDEGVFSPIVPARNTIVSTVLNNLEIINDYFDSRLILKQHFWKFFNIKYGKHLIKSFTVLPWRRVLGFYDSHIPVSHKKENFELLWLKEEGTLQNTSKNKFRTKMDVNHWLMRYWNLSQGRFIPRSTNFGKYYNISDENKELYRDISRSHHKVLCLNDGRVDDFEKIKSELIEVLSQKFPKKSDFEK